MTPAIRLDREVARTSSECHWCAYPVVEPSPRYVPRIGGVALHKGYCSHRCAVVEARVRGRGPLALRYGGES